MYASEGGGELRVGDGGVEWEVGWEGGDSAVKVSVNYVRGEWG